MEESALIIPVTLPPSLEALRLSHDPSAQLFPSHISVIFPFAPAAEHEQIAPHLQSIIAARDRFTVAAEAVETFEAGESFVIFLRVSPSRPIAHLIRKIHESFPKYPPYGGRFESLVPHITLARAHESDKGAILGSIRDAYEAAPTMSFPVDQVEWLTADMASPSNCHIIEKFPLR